MEETGRHIGADARKMALIHLGQRLRSARMKAGKTQSFVADLLRTSTQTVRNWEAGRNEPPRQAIAQLAPLYSVHQSDLLYGNYTWATPPDLPSDYHRAVVDQLRMIDARRLSGLTQESVARLAGVSATSISRYERGVAHPTIDTLEILADIYGVPVYLLIYSSPYTDEEWAHLQQSMGEPDAFRAADAFYEANAETVLDAYYRPNAERVLDAYYEAKADLSPEAETTIARFINFIHKRELRRGTSYWTKRY